MKGRVFRITALVVVGVLLFTATVAFAKENSLKNRIKITSQQTNESELQKIQERMQVRTTTREMQTTASASTKKHLFKAFTVYGKLISANENEFIVRVLKATKNAKDYEGKEVAFRTLQKTKITGSRYVKLFEEGLILSPSVIINGYEKDGILFARKVLVKAPRRVVLNGSVVSLAENGFVMHVKTSNSEGKSYSGKEVMVRILDFTKITYPATLTAEIKPGYYVNVVGFEKDGAINALRVVLKAASVATETTSTSTSAETATKQSSETVIKNTSSAITSVPNAYRKNSSEEDGAKSRIAERYIYRAFQAIQNTFKRMLASISDLIKRMI